MGDYQSDWEQALAFRAVIHAEALKKVQRTHPEIRAVVDLSPVEAYMKAVWDYPGAWYTYIAVPDEYPSRDALIDAIVKNTIKANRKQ